MDYLKTWIIHISITLNIFLLAYLNSPVQSKKEIRPLWSSIDEVTTGISWGLYWFVIVLLLVAANYIIWRSFRYNNY